MMNSSSSDHRSSASAHVSLVSSELSVIFLSAWLCLGGCPSPAAASLAPPRETAEIHEDVKIPAKPVQNPASAAKKQSPSAISKKESNTIPEKTDPANVVKSSDTTKATVIDTDASKAEKDSVPTTVAPGEPSRELDQKSEPSVTATGAPGKPSDQEPEKKAEPNSASQPSEKESVKPSAQMPAKTPSSRITVQQKVLPLPGALDDVPFFVSNSPEIVLEPGVLLSTYPKQIKVGEGKTEEEAHLNHPLSGRFDVFFHHVTNATKTGTARTLYLGMLIGNASNKKVHVEILQAVSYATKPDAPFIDLDSVLDNEKGKIFAGPGDRVNLDFLRDHKQHGWHQNISLEPGESKLVYNLPLPVKSLIHPLNGRTGLIKMNSDGPVYLASLADFGQKKKYSDEHKPDLKRWKEVLEESHLVRPRDKTPTPPGAKGALVFGRVAGVAKGSSWTAVLSSGGKNDQLTLSPNEMVSFPISTIIGGTLGTNQVQAAPLAVRYRDTAYQSHGNYGALYDLTIPLFNNSDSPMTAGISLQTPLKDWNHSESLQFFAQPPNQIFFRGTIQFEWTDENQKRQHKFVHLVEKRGQSVQPLIELTVAPHQTQEVRARLFYPADCTPPQVLTITNIHQ